MPIRTRTATRLSCFAAFAVIAAAACAMHSPPMPDATDPFTGDVDCGSDACGSDQLCYIQYAGIPDAAAIQYTCLAIPHGCKVADCFDNQCPTCITQNCEIPDAAQVSGRTVTCQGE